MYFLGRFVDSGKFLLTYLRKSAHCSYRPLAVMIEPTNICNLKCSMCANNIMTRKNGYMPFELYKEIINCNFDFIRHLDLFLLGESLLHSQISQMVKYARKFNIWTRIFTNATLLDEKMSKDLILSGLNTVTISFEGVNKRHYEKIRKGATYEDILGKIQKLISTKRSLKRRFPHISVKFININFNAEELKLFIAKMKQMGVDSVDEMAIHGWPDGNIIKNMMLENNRNSNRYYHCVLPWAVISVLWDGKVVGCCDDFDGLYEIGDIKETPYLAKIWNGRRMITLREKLIKKEYFDIPHCKNCGRVWKPPFCDAIFRNALWGLKERFL